MKFSPRCGREPEFGVFFRRQVHDDQAIDAASRRRAGTSTP
jgi:hypothetical protein